MSGMENKLSWPSAPVNKNHFDGDGWPKLSIVIPSYNQGQFLEETLLSVINQNYPNLEIILIDGGSTDETLSVIQKYEKFLSYWVSEKDNGQSHAINKGFKIARGKYVAWINSDDCYLENYFYNLFSKIKDKDYDFIYGNKGLVGETISESKEFNLRKIIPFKLKYLVRFFSSVDYIIPSQSVFISKDTLNNVGLLNEELHYCMDLDFFCRIVRTKPNYFVYKEKAFFYRTGLHTKTQLAQEKMFLESLEIAKLNCRYLSLVERMLVKYEINYVKKLKNIYNQSFIHILYLLIRYPIYSIRDKRVLGLIKQKLLNIIGIKIKN